jgi:hypothetical protein
MLSAAKHLIDLHSYSMRCFTPFSMTVSFMVFRDPAYSVLLAAYFLYLGL